MATIELTEADFGPVLDENDIVLVDFWAAWCGPCRIFAPVFERVSARHPDIVFGKVDTDSEIALAQAHNIRSIPTLMVARDAVVLHSLAGALPERALEQLIQKVRELDMQQVHSRSPDRPAERPRYPAAIWPPR